MERHFKDKGNYIMSIENIDNRIPNEELKDLARKQEPSFLSILIKDKNMLMDAVSFGIKEDHFWNKHCRFLYSIIFDNFTKNGALLTRSAMHHITDMLTIDVLTEERKMFYKGFWDEINNLEAPVEDFELLKKAINDRYVQWQTYNIFTKYTEQIVHSTNSQIDLTKKIQEDISSIDNVDPESYTVVIDMDKALDKSMEYINYRKNNPDEGRGLLCGISALDKVFNGFEKGMYTVITGFIGGGKTTLMFNMAFNMAKAGYNVVYVTLEKDAVPLNTRLLTLHALVDYNRVLKGGTGEWGLTNEIYQIINDAYLDLKNVIKPNLEYIQLPQTTKLSKILAEINKVKARKKVDAIFVDYLQAIGFESAHPSRPDIDLANVSKRLQAYGRINKYATFTGIQIKGKSTANIRGKAKQVKAGSEPENVEIHTEDISGSQMIIADADYGIGIVKSCDKPPTKAFITITKGRDVEQDKVLTLDFDGRVGRISDPDFEASQIKEVNDIVYSKQVTIDSTTDTVTDTKEIFGEEEKPFEFDPDKKRLEENRPECMENILKSFDKIEPLKADGVVEGEYKDQKEADDDLGF